MSDKKEYQLILLDVCLPDYFQGYSGEFQPVIAYVNNEATYQDILENIESTTNNEARGEPGFWDAFESAIKNFPNQLGASDCMTNRAFPDLESCECDPDNHECDSIIAYFAIEPKN